MSKPQWDVYWNGIGWSKRLVDTTYRWHFFGWRQWQIATEQAVFPQGTITKYQVGPVMLTVRRATPEDAS